MNKKGMNRWLSMFLAGVLVISALMSMTGCSVLDPLGVSRESAVVSGGETNQDDGDFLSSEEVMTFFENAPGEKINAIYSFLKAIINATYIDELEMDTSKKGYETMAWHIAYGILNEYAREDKAIKYVKKKGEFTVSEELALEYIESSFAGVTSKKSKEIAELLNTYNTMVTFNKKKAEYTMLSTDVAEFNAELVDLKVAAGKIKVNDTKVDGAVFTYQLTDMSESKINLGKVKVTLIKNETSKFGYNLAKVSYSKKGIGEPTVIVATPAPEETPKAKKNKKAL